METKLTVLIISQFTTAESFSTTETNTMVYINIELHFNKNLFKNHVRTFKERQ